MGYNSSVLYHNNYHGADVTQVSAWILLIPEIRAKLGQKDIFAVLFAAIIHDFRSVCKSVLKLVTSSNSNISFVMFLESLISYFLLDSSHTFGVHTGTLGITMPSKSLRIPSLPCGILMMLFWSICTSRRPFDC
jgi:hypothetical protein